MTMDLCTVKHSFAELMGVMNPWTLSHFVMWLDIKVAEYKIYGKMVLDNKSVTTPEWLRNKNLDNDTEVSNGQLSKDPVQKRERERRHSLSQQHQDSQHLQSRLNPKLEEAERIPVGTNVVDLSSYSDSVVINDNIINRSLASVVNEVEKGRGMLEPHPTQSSSSYGESYVQGHGLYPVHPVSVARIPQVSASRSPSERHHVSHSVFSVNTHVASGSQLHSQTYTTEKPRPTDNLHTIVNRSRAIAGLPLTQHQVAGAVASQFRQNMIPKSDAILNPQNQSTLSNAEMFPIKIEILDDDSCDKTPSHIGQEKSLPDFGRTFATGSRHTSSSSLSANQDQLPHTVLEFETSIQDQGHTSGLVNLEDYHNALGQQVPISNVMYATSQPGEEPQVSMEISTEGGDQDEESTENKEQSWKYKKWQYIESLRGNSDTINPKVQSRIMQRTKVFPDPFPVENLKYGNKARDLINSGIITRPAKMQFLDTVFNEIVKYTGLYPTPTQKMEVAKAIVRTFPKLNVRSKDSHISPADSWFVVLNDKFRNERRGLSNQSYQSQQMRQRALITVRRAQARMYNMAAMSRSSGSGFSGVVKDATDQDDGDNS